MYLFLRFKYVILLSRYKLNVNHIYFNLFRNVKFLSETRKTNRKRRMYARSEKALHSKAIKVGLSFCRPSLLQIITAQHFFIVTGQYNFTKRRIMYNCYFSTWSPPYEHIISACITSQYQLSKNTTYFKNFFAGYLMIYANVFFFHIYFY